MNPLASGSNQGLSGAASMALATSELLDRAPVRGGGITAFAAVSPTSQSRTEGTLDGNQLLAQLSHYFDGVDSDSPSELMQSTVLSWLGNS